MTALKNIIITSGEPAGIGPDICLDIDSRYFFDHAEARVLVLADAELMRERARIMDKAVNKTTAMSGATSLRIHQDIHQAIDNFDPDCLNIIDIKLAHSCVAGTLDVANANYVLQLLDTAIDLCKQGMAAAMVTGPIHKRIISELGRDFTGHTEYLAERAASTADPNTQTGKPITPVMMLATESMRVALATTHLPLKDVSAAIKHDMLIEKLEILHNFLHTNAGIPAPRILVCGLNPHAGEDGTLGTEENEIIRPALDRLRQKGLLLEGPLPADTLFTPRHLAHADAVFAMYHDQGLPVLKYSGFGKAVNVTLGLPFIRTSVDHGTALELAASGKANSSSLFEAIKLACNLQASPQAKQ